MIIFWTAIAIFYGFCAGIMYVTTADPCGHDTWSEFFRRRLWIVAFSPPIFAYFLARDLWKNR